MLKRALLGGAPPAVVPPLRLLLLSSTVLSSLLLSSLVLCSNCFSSLWFSQTLDLRLQGGSLLQRDERLKQALQQAVDHALEGHGHAGSIVVIDVESGEILAAKNLELAGKQLIRPGSTLKPFVLMALLDSGKLDPKQRLICRRPLRIGGLRLDCSHTQDVSQLDADDAIAYSCNSYVAEVALRLSGSELVEALRRAGLDSLSGLVKSESAGHIDHPASQEQLQLMALGARGIEVTSLELLAAYRKLALRKRSGSISPDEAVFLGLEHAITYGTAHAAFVVGVKIAGKTGTASTANTPRTHGVFVGYAPADQPEIAIVVYLLQGRGLDAAMAAQFVLEAYGQVKKKP
jgi:cell division protein FtsI/penicillin-binding protein 2